MIILKKILSLVLVVGMLISILSVTVGAEGDAELTAVEKSEMKLRRADADGNGTYSVADVQLLLRVAAGVVEDNAKYDVNLDGVTSVEDALAVLKEISGVKPILSNEEAVELFNAKVNNVKKRDTGLPGFTKTTVATCDSMKITQDVKASGLAVIVADSMRCTDLEYDKYVEKMVGLMEGSGELNEEQKKQIAAMRQSAEDYKKPQTETATAEAGNYVQHFLEFPRNAKNTASEITTADISSITYKMENWNIIYTLRMPNKEYSSLTAYNANPYKKVMNVVEFDDSNGSKLTSAKLRNGTVVITTDAATGSMKNANYSYSYYSVVQAPSQTQSDSSFGSITITVTSKTSATITESVVF